LAGELLVITPQQHWTQASVGLATMTAGWIGLTVQAPIGAAIDATHAKRALVVLSLLLLATGAVTIFAVPTFWMVMLAAAASLLSVMFSARWWRQSR
jgi:hypothetical protein